MWAIQIFFLTFVLSLTFSLVSEILLSKSNATIAFILLSILIIFNIFFDIIAVAATCCNSEMIFKIAKKNSKSRTIALRLIANAEKVNNICADVIGDICGIVSGALGATIVIKIFAVGGLSVETTIIGILFSALTASLTVGGKAAGKKIAIASSASIILSISKLLSIFTKKEK